jgi:hypothetical protein
LARPFVIGELAEPAKPADEDVDARRDIATGTSPS